jgi:Tfp pilus assembly protein PilF
MVLQGMQHSFARRLFVVFGALSAIVMLGVTCPAQEGGIDPDPGMPGSGGRNMIQGHVYYPSGRTVDKRVKVTLTSLKGGEFFTLSDDNGVFGFRRVGGGTYIVAVDAGKEYEQVSETLDVAENTRANPVGITYTMQIQLRLRPANANAKPGVVNASAANVPKAAADLYQQGIASLNAGDRKKALEQLNAAVTLYPTFVLALNQISAIYMGLGQLDKAEEAVAAAVKYEPENPTLRLNYGYVLLLRGRLVESEQELGRAVQLRDSYALAHLYRGRVLIRLRKFAQAEIELNRVLGLGGDPSVIAHKYLAALYKEKGELPKAIAELENYLKLVPSDTKEAEQVRAVLKELRDKVSPSGNQASRPSG